MRLREVAAAIGARIRGDQEIEVTGVAPLDGAGPGDICLYLGGKFRKDLEKTGARALVTAPGTQLPGFTVLEVERPRLAFIGVIRLFHPEKTRTGVQPGAVVSPGAKLGRDVFVGATAVVGDGCVVGDGVEIHEGAVLYQRVRVGDGSRLYARVVIREDCEIGRNVILHAGAVIGADGFGFEPDARGVFHKIPQVGRVVVEDDVEIGANTCIDRAALGETRIGRGVKIDNLCQLGHGVKVGEDTVISGMTGISGSVNIGRHVVIGGGVGIGDHLTIGDGVMIAGRTGVAGNVPAGSIIAGLPHTDLRTWKKAMVMLYRMPRKGKGDPEGED